MTTDTEPTSARVPGPVVQDRLGAVVEAGGFVTYRGERYEVLGVLPDRNVVQISLGNVSAVECELTD